MGGSVDDLRQRAAEEIAEREKLERVVDVAPDADARPDPLAALRSEPDEDQPAWRHNP
jgi:capsid protein